MLHPFAPVSAPAARNLENAALAYAAPRKPPTHWTARFEQCVVRTACREVLVGGETRVLQPRAFELLTYLIENRGRVVSADELLDSIWRTEEVQLGSLAAAIMRVRRALREESVGRGSMIRTYTKFGYRFVARTTVDFDNE